MPELLEPRSRSRRFQFSLSWLLATTAAVAVVLGLWLAAQRRAEFRSRPSRLSQAIQRGDLREVDRLLKLEPQLASGWQHRGFSSSHGPLQKALLFGTPEIVERILKERPDLNERGDDGDTALLLTAMHHNYDYMARLLQLGANPNLANKDGVAPLHLAAKFDQNGRFIKLLLDHGADPNQSQTTKFRQAGKQPLHGAAESQNTSAVRQLIAGGANVNGRDEQGRTPLHVARSTDVCKELVARGADPIAKDADGRIPGEMAEGTNAESVASMWWELILQYHDQKRTGELDKLLAKAPQVLTFRTNSAPDTMLQWAVIGQARLDVFDYLLAHGMDPDARDRQGNTTLHYACEHPSSAEFARRLVKKGANVHARNNLGETPLHLAVRMHKEEVVQLLLDAGADLAARDKAGTMVMDAAFERQFHLPGARKTLELLRQAGHPPTVLYAAAIGDIALLEQLTGGGSNAMLTLLEKPYTPAAVRPLHAAVLGRQPAMIEWLLKQGASCDPPLSEAYGVATDTPLMVALSYSQTDIALLLIERGADVNRKSWHGHYPAHAAVAWERDPVILEALLARGANVSLKWENKTVLEVARASRSGYKARYLELLLENGSEQVAARRAAR